MYIIIIGAGKIGFFLAKRLLQDKQTVSIIDTDKDRCEQVARELEVLVVNGDGCEPHILQEAGIERADVVAAVTGEDEANLVVTTLGKFEFKVQRTIARVNNPKNAWLFTPEMGVDVSLNQAD